MTFDSSDRTGTFQSKKRHCDIRNIHHGGRHYKHCKCNNTRPKAIPSRCDNCGIFSCAATPMAATAVDALPECLTCDGIVGSNVASNVVSTGARQLQTTKRRSRLRASLLDRYIQPLHGNHYFVVLCIILSITSTPFSPTCSRPLELDISFGKIVPFRVLYHFFCQKTVENFQLCDNRVTTV